MSSRLKLKISVDILMTILLLVVMGYMVTGEEAHEWFGMGLFALFFFHNWLNRQWYGSLLKGSYNRYRILHTAVNLLLVVDMIAMMISSIILSRYIFDNLPIHGGMELARNMHMTGAYWGFLLMSVHLGFHWGMMMGMMKQQKESAISSWLLRGLALGTSVYGAWVFVKNDLFSYMMLKNLFVFFDYSQPTILFFTEYIAMMVLWATIAYYVSMRLKTGSGSKQVQKNNKDLIEGGK